MELTEYIPFLVGAGLFIGAIFAGIFKGKEKQSSGIEPEEGTRKEVIAGVLQDNYSMLMMSEQLRTNKEEMVHVVNTMKDLINELERLREYARDISKVLETKTKM